MNLSKLSISLSLIGIIIAIYMQYNLVIEYEFVSGKTKALYSLKQLPYFSYTFFGIIGLVLSIISFFFKEKLKIVALTSSLAVLSILVFIMDLWYFFN